MVEHVYLALILSGATIFAVLFTLLRQATRASRLQLALIRLNEEQRFDTPDFLRHAWPLLARAGVRGLAWRLDWFGVPVQASHGATDGNAIARHIEVGDMRVAIELHLPAAGGERRYFEATIIEIFVLLLRTNMWIKAGATDATFTQMAKLTLFLEHDMKNIAQFIQLMGDQMAAIPEGREQQALDYLRAAVPLIRNRADRIVATLTADLARAGTGAIGLREEIALMCRLYRLDSEIRGQATLPACDEVVSGALDNILKNYRDHAPGQRLLIAIGSIEGGTDITIETAQPTAPLHLERLFEPFWSSDPNGLGIGLYQARQSLASAGGSLEAARSASGALQFRLQLPRAQHAPSAAA